MAYEDFDTYTEGADEGNDITKDSSTKISWLNLISRQETGYWYKDYGLNHFSGDYTHLFECLFDNIQIDTLNIFYGLSTGIGDSNDWRTNNNDVAYFRLYNDAEDLAVVVLEGGILGANDNWAQPGPQSNVLYFVTFDRDDDGGVNNTGRYTVYIRTGSHEGVLQDTLIVDSSAGEQNDFRYVYPIATQDDGFSGSESDGYTQNLDLQEAAGSLSRDIAGSLPAMSGALTRKHYAKRPIQGAI